MPLLRQRIILAVFLLVVAISSNLLAEQTNTQPTTNAQEPADTSFDEAISHGVAAYKNARYLPALQHFKQALVFDPASSQARLYLGTTYAVQVVPYLDTRENLATAQNAIDILKQIPETATEYLPALRQIVLTYRNTTRLEEAKTTELQVLKIDPADFEAHYTIGAIDWMQAHKNAVRVLATAYLLDDGYGNPKLNTSACFELRDLNAALIQDGIDHLTRAIDLKPDYEDAMQYLNLTYRRRADIACKDDTKRTEDLAQAQQWTQKALAVRQQHNATIPTPPPK